ncbi:hypothetical protein ACQ1Q5_00380 [Ornithobacterium rhinotracheale]
MDLIKGESISDLVRVDRNLSFHYDYFRKYSSDDSNLMFYILIYLAKKHQGELFGHGYIDPVEFCETFEIEPTHCIWRKHPSPKQFEELTEEKIENLRKTKPETLFETIFENALFCLLKDNFTFIGDFYLSKESRHGQGVKLNSIQFITNLRKGEIKVKRNLKKVYWYELGVEFMNNLSFLFFDASMKSLQEPYVKKNQGLYIYLKDLKNTMIGEKKNNAIIKFDVLKQKLEIESDSAPYVKKKITQALTRILLLDDLKELGFEWIRGKDQKYAYTIKLSRQSTNEEDEKLLEKTWSEIDSKIFRKSMLDAFKRRYPEFAIGASLSRLKEKYTEWLKRPELDADTKRAAYIDASKMCDKEEFFVQKQKYGHFENIEKKIANDYKRYL